MDKVEFYRRLGLQPPGDKGTEIVVTKDRLEKVAPAEIANESNSALKASEEEISRLKSKLLEMEKSQQRDSQHMEEQLRNANNMLAELQGEVKSSASIIQAQQLLDTLKGLQSRVSELEEAFKASACPSCGEHITWEKLEIKELPESEFEKTGKPSIFPFDFGTLIGQRTMRFRECPYCHHIKQV